MAEMAMLIDYEWCTGCHSCEVACNVEHDFAQGQNGLVLNTIGPWETGPDTWEFTNFVFPTHLCDTCGERRAMGKRPSCEHHCQARCLRVGELDELQAVFDQKPNQALYRLG